MYGRKEGWTTIKFLFYLYEMKKINTFKCTNYFILICTDGRKEGRKEGLTTDKFLFYLYEKN